MGGTTIERSIANNSSRRMEQASSCNRTPATQHPVTEGAMSTSDSNPNEIWRPIPNSPGYQASSLGRISGPRGILKTKLNKTVGYYEASIATPNGRKTKYVHRLVAAAFFGELRSWQVVNHRDRCRTNNQLINLEIVGTAENRTHMQVLDWVRIAVRLELQEFLAELRSRVGESIPNIRERTDNAPAIPTSAVSEEGS